MKEFKNWFSKGGCTEKFIRKQVNRAGENYKEKDEQHIKGNDVPLLVTYNANF